MDAGIDVVVGTNKYRLPPGEEESVEVLSISNEQVRDAQIEKLKVGRGALLRVFSVLSHVLEALCLCVCRPFVQHVMRMRLRLPSRSSPSLHNSRSPQVGRLHSHTHTAPMSECTHLPPSHLRLQLVVTIL